MSVAFVLRFEKMKIAFILICLLSGGLSFGQSTPQFQDTNVLRTVAEEFLSTQTTNSLGKASITIGKIDPRLKLPACINLSPFLMPGSKPWGKLTIGIRCLNSTSWVIYVSAQVSVTVDYYVTATTLSLGQMITSADIRKVNGDLSILPVGAITNPSQAIGKLLNISLISGSVLRTDALKSMLAIQQGQSIKVISTGPGFQVSTDAMALNNANDGQIAKAKTISGQLISGVARTGGIIDVSF